MALKDTDKMPWGVHMGKAMANVPAKYLLWLYQENKCNAEVREYIEENMEGLKQEIKPK